MTWQVTSSFESVLMREDGRVVFSESVSRSQFTVRKVDSCLESPAGYQDYEQMVVCVCTLAKISENSISSVEFRKEYYDTYIKPFAHRVESTSEAVNQYNSTKDEVDFLEAFDKLIRATFLVNFAFPERHSIKLVECVAQDISEPEFLLKKELNT